MDSAKAMTSTSVVTMMVRKEKEPKSSSTVPMDQATATKGVAATRMAPQKERSANRAMKAPRPKP
ncbi:hypothetical protein D3C87_1821740 [compost metagenome]